MIGFLLIDLNLCWLLEIVFKLIEEFKYFVFMWCLIFKKFMEGKSGKFFKILSVVVECFLERYYVINEEFM